MIARVCVYCAQVELCAVDDAYSGTLMPHPSFGVHHQYYQCISFTCAVSAAVERYEQRVERRKRITMERLRACS